MTNPTLKSIVKLFSLFSNIESNTYLTKAASLLEFYLSSYVQKSYIDEFVEMFKFYNNQYTLEQNKDFFKNISLKSVKTLRTVDIINKELNQKEKIYLFVHLVEILKHKQKISADEFDFLETIGFSFNISKNIFRELKNFIIYSCDEVTHKENILLISNKPSSKLDPNVKHIRRNNLEGELCFLYISYVDLFLFYYQGTDTLFLNDKEIQPNKIYQFIKGNSISSYKMGLQNVKLKPVYYTELGMHFLPSDSIEHVNLLIEDVYFQYPGRAEGIQPFRFQSESFMFVGVVGSSGVGKSTLLNILNGNLVPQKGSVKINGYDLRQHKEEFKGLIGYVPQEDLLFESLTVYQNLYYNAKLCFDNYSEEEIEDTINGIMDELNLSSIHNSKVGGKFEKIISGGQRKRVNLALELMREPSILLVDEPTSGLSSSDSMNIINLLREQTLKGKLVIANVHQPSSGIYKLFDQLIVLDKGGYPVYTGDPLEGLVYFKTIGQQVDAQNKECPVCGNINPDILLNIIEEMEVDEKGDFTGQRKIPPEKWYSLYKENIESEKEFKPQKETIPPKNFKPPNSLKQWSLFFRRNLQTKVENTQYLLISLLEAPLLATILAFFTKYTVSDESGELAYNFSQNVNLPSYLLMSIIVVLFIGMLVSAEEIINDKNVLEREKFLNLSSSSYLLSKVMYLFILSGIQVISFVVIGNSILEIEGMTLNYWLILFSSACFANMLGLNISAGLKSQVAIYVLIPFLLIPQILLSGTIVKFDKLHGKLTSELYPPVIADLMPSRWAYEALAVTQFRDNAFEKKLYSIEEEESKFSYKMNYYIPELISILDKCRTQLIFNEVHDQKELNDNRLLLINELGKLHEETGKPLPLDLDKLRDETFSENKISLIESYLNEIRRKYSRKLDEILYQKDQVIENYNDKNADGQAWAELNNNHYNHALAELVKRKDNPEKVIRKNNQLYRKFEPVFKTPSLKNGRAEFYSPVKRLGNQVFLNTVTFNVLVIWLFIILLYITLYFRIIEKCLEFFQKKRIKDLT
ncbi:MAG: ATP-binding cassette domain-containing protein [Bacteroidota bacterium]